MTSAISFKKRHLHIIVVLLSLLIIFILGPFLFYNINYMGRIYPNIYVAGINVGGDLPSEAVSALDTNIKTPDEINLLNKTQSFQLNTQDIDPSYDYIESVNRAYNLTRTGNFILDSFERIQLLTTRDKIGLVTSFDENQINNYISTISEQIDVNPIYPSIEDFSGNIQVNTGKPGYRVENQMLRADIGRALSYADSADINIPLYVVDPTITQNQSDAAKTRAEKYLGKSLSLKFESQTFNYNESDILAFLNPSGGYDDTSLENASAKIASAINRDPQDPKFQFNGTRVTEFQPALSGIALDKDGFKKLLVFNLDKLENSADKNITFGIPVITTDPGVTTDQVNNLGIKELIGQGNSTYFHSIPGRVYNVNLAASRINGTLVKPGDTFSFNQTLGDVSKFSGYQQAYIISNGRTVLGDGGGVCQVSTTLFRAALNAGLPIVERTAHAYRVGYYEQNSPPGIDATVYSPSPDFKFTNDTGNYILIEAINDPVNYSLTFDIYGTGDGRTSKISKPVVSNITPPLPTVYQDDPTLPVGTLKQTDFAASGARVTFNYVVTRNGQTLENQTFVSNYQPWAAVYLRGTKL